MNFGKFNLSTIIVFVFLFIYFFIASNWLEVQISFSLTHSIIWITTSIQYAI